MRLTDKEMEIMAVLWESETAMTATEIIEVSNNRTWKESSIYIII
jgi:predicted transcriptional regulator